MNVSAFNVLLGYDIYIVLNFYLLSVNVLLKMLDEFSTTTTTTIIIIIIIMLDEFLCSSSINNKYATLSLPN